MPLPLPVMIPFMMWQSAAIAAGFGTYFQFAKRKVSAMSNEEFNKTNPHKLVSDLYDDIIEAMPSSFAKIDSMTPIILDSMLKMLTNALDWFAGVLGGTGLTELQRRLAGGGALNPFDTGTPTGSPVGEGTETQFIAGESGQASIPSVAWLNNLNRNQLKAIRNDALRGDYNASSKQLILARYKEIFEFDRGASLSEPGIGVPISSVTFKHPQNDSILLKGLHKLVVKRLLQYTQGQMNLIYILLNAQFAQFKRATKTARTPESRAANAAMVVRVTTLIQYYNKFLPNT